MSDETSAPDKLIWEWPADRAVENVLIISVNKMEKYSQGVFGLKASPSIASSLPDPIKLEGQVISKSATYKNVEIVLPSVEIKDVAIYDTIKVGLSKENVVICVKKLAGIIDEAGVAKESKAMDCN